LETRKLAPAVIKEAGQVLGFDIFLEQKLRRERSIEFRKQFGFTTPSFLVISPSKACNLRCMGCYADSDKDCLSLEWGLVHKIVEDARKLWGTQFIVISGGEPLAYRSQGKTILDLAEKHKDTYFMMYTNGTLITPEIAQRMSELGNLVPMISLEGWREETDARRGEGVFDKVMNAMDLLDRAGVIYGSSLTATRKNAEEILSDEFMDYLFLQKHISICWIFQYMPIGRSFTLDLMPSPQQRIWMWKQSWQLVREKRYFVADFWNHGTLVNGCLSAGGHDNGGYLYIEWNGNVTPCVFVPFSPVNVKDVYARGGNLNDIYAEPFFADIRKWQRDSENKNLLTPCLIRDHNLVLRRLICKNEADPIDLNASQALQDREYAEGLDRYADEYSQIANGVWERDYLEHESVHVGDDEDHTFQIEEFVAK
jgi:MoaA/NifB/PqqE/SkfB family radical SAM enzyme